MSYHGFASRYVGLNAQEDLLEYLTPRQRVILHLYYEEGFNQYEVADILNMPQRAVSREVYRAKITSASLYMAPHIYELFAAVH